MKLTATLIFAAAIGAAPLDAQARTQRIYSFPFGSATVTVEAGSDSAVHVHASRDGVVASPTERLDSLPWFMRAVAQVVFGSVAVEPGQYVDQAEVGDGQIRIARRAYHDSSRYTVAFHGGEPGQPVLTVVHRPELMVLLGMLQRADSVSRWMSGLAPVPIPRSNGNASAAAPANRPYFEFQVEEQVRLLPDSPMPVYPEALKRANVEGQVLAQFVVDTMGRADPSTLKILMASNNGFSQALRDALPQMRFSPALVGGRKVPQLVQRPFTFATH